MIVSVQCGWYQKLNVELPDGTDTVCVSVLLPFTGLVEPTRAECVPACAVVPITGVNAQQRTVRVYLDACFAGEKEIYLPPERITLDR